MAHIFSGISGSLFFWRLAHIFLDNRTQKGKCAITGAILEIENMYCHHKKPLIMGGEDKYKNLIFVTKAIHRLIHEPDESKIKVAATALPLDGQQVEKLIVLNNLAIKVF